MSFHQNEKNIETISEKCVIVNQSLKYSFIFLAYFKYCNAELRMHHCAG